MSSTDLIQPGTGTVPGTVQVQSTYPIHPEAVSEPALFRVHSDGGGNHDFAYGSWEIVFDRYVVREHRISFKDYRNDRGRAATCNVAEYLALLGALDWLNQVPDLIKQFSDVEIYGDSQLMIRQLLGQYRCKKEHLRILKDDCHVILARFGYWSAKWVRRTEMVSRFGH